MSKTLPIPSKDSVFRVFSLALFCFIALLPVITLRDFTPNNELKYLSIADEALRDRHFFAFFNHGIPYADKPPLYLWIVMAGRWMFGTHSLFFLSLFSLIPAFVSVGVMDRWCRDRLSSEERRCAALMLLTCGLFLGSGIVLRMDMLMCMFILLALYTFYRLYSGEVRKADRWLFPLYTFLALFTKGPIGILVPILSVVVFLSVQRKGREILHYLNLRFWLVILGLCAVWWTGAYLDGGSDYLNNLLFHQTIDRAHNAFHHKEPFWYYGGVIWYALAPWSLYFFATLLLRSVSVIKNKTAGWSHRSPLTLLFLVIVVSTFVALSAFSGKLAIYLLPIFSFFPYLTMMLARSVPEKQNRWALYLPGVLVSGGGIAVLLPSSPVPYAALTAVRIAAVICILGGAFSLLFLIKRQNARAITIVSLAFYLALFAGGWAMPKVNPEIGFSAVVRQTEALASTIETATGVAPEICFYQIRSGENMDIYFPQGISRIETEEAFLEKVESESSLIIIREKWIKANRREAWLLSVPHERVGAFYILLPLANTEH